MTEQRKDENLNVVDAEIIEETQDLNGNGIPDHLEQPQQGYNGYQQPQQGYNGYQQPQQGYNGYQQPQQGYNGYQQPQQGMYNGQQGFNQYQQPQPQMQHQQQQGYAQQQTQWMEPEQYQQPQQSYAPQVTNNEIIEGFQSKEAVQLTPEQAQFAQNLKESIPTGDLQGLATFGTDVQKQLGTFSNTMLNNVKGKDTGAIGKELGLLMTTIGQIDINDFDDESKKPNFVQKLFKKAKKKKDEFMVQHMTIASQVDTIANKLQQNQTKLLADVGNLDQIYAQNENYLGEVDAYVTALKLKLYELQTVDMANKRKEMEENPQDMLIAQEMQDLTNFATSVEKRIDDLVRTKAITVQSLPQIRMIQATSYELCKKIDNSIHTVIPLWQNQLSIAITLKNQREAVEAQKAVTDTTNNLLLKNSEMLKTNTLATAEENERGIVEIETLKQTQQNLIDTIKGVQQIQEEGSKKRATAEAEIEKMQEDMSRQMLEIAKNQQDRATGRDVVDMPTKRLGTPGQNPFSQQYGNQHQQGNFNQQYGQQPNFNGQTGGNMGGQPNPFVKR